MRPQQFGGSAVIGGSAKFSNPAELNRLTDIGNPASRGVPRGDEVYRKTEFWRNSEFPGNATRTRRLSPRLGAYLGLALIDNAARKRSSGGAPSAAAEFANSGLLGPLRQSFFKEVSGDRRREAPKTFRRRATYRLRRILGLEFFHVVLSKQFPSDPIPFPADFPVSSL